ncbi:MAG: class II aldolase/adducin family protein [Caldilineaceae bacterium]
MAAPIRYKVEKKAPIVRSEDEWRAEIIEVCHKMWQRGLVGAADGNVSVRLSDDRFLCTPSGFSKGSGSRSTAGDRLGRRNLLAAARGE